jgi:hypothetical protein
VWVNEHVIWFFLHNLAKCKGYSIETVHRSGWRLYSNSLHHCGCFSSRMGVVPLCGPFLCAGTQPWNGASPFTEAVTAFRTAAPCTECVALFRPEGCVSQCEHRNSATVWIEGDNIRVALGFDLLKHVVQSSGKQVQVKVS